jgi:hypothetical protein
MKKHKILNTNNLINLFLLVFLVFPLTIKSQNMSIFGNVIDTLNNSSDSMTYVSGCVVS